MGPKFGSKNAIYLAFLGLKWPQLVSKTWFVASWAKSMQNGIFRAKNLFQKNFPMLFLSPNPSYAKNRAKRASKWVYYSMSITEAPACRVKLTQLCDWRIIWFIVIIDFSLKLCWEGNEFLKMEYFQKYVKDIYWWQLSLISGVVVVVLKSNCSW